MGSRGQSIVTQFAGQIDANVKGKLDSNESAR